jgi:crotonobetainyl-CoA:carnitine CoA-transferase CaiB-like acyl-CoA transferase
MKLEGIRVVDLSLFLPGPAVTLMMADHGADILKIENPKGGEPGRYIGYKQAGETVFFRNSQRGKRSLTLNLKEEDGKAILLKLVKTADVFVESFRPGVMKRLGIDYETLRKINPGLIYCSIAAFGQTGPMRDQPAHDTATAALSGVSSITRSHNGGPAIVGIASADMLASHLAFGGIMMALVRKNTTGEGDFIDIGMHDSLMNAQTNLTGPVFAEDRAPVLNEERSLGGNAMLNIYETSDGMHVALGGAEAKFTKNLFDGLGRPEFIEPVCGDPGPGHWPAQEYLREEFKTKTRAEWVDWFSGRDICFAPVLDLKEAWDHPQVWAREMRLKDPDGIDHMGIPIKFQNEPGKVNFKTPGLGEHADEILKEYDYSDADIASFRERGVI